MSSGETTSSTTDENRPMSANFSPSIWGDYFMSCASNPSIMEMDKSKAGEKMVELKKEVKRNIVEVDDSVENPSEKLKLIDAIQRLGVSYYFQEEIEVVLQQLHNNLHNYDDKKYDDDDLYIVALRFRLLR
ncbi:Terpene synthase, N-terminal domain containing protein [Trema orientale]|uniref:Terpene synthase, N-terminal domain containing protein n=1 Tax=Trema orientale TaxID=63057 RepID=A0A2P5FBL8_TREOI|nr:Terpene synthase, N-terminal domain containing protein [Trema orientale]